MTKSTVGRRLREAHESAEWLLHITRDAQSSCWNDQKLTAVENEARAVGGLLGVYDDFRSIEWAVAPVRLAAEDFAAVRSESYQIAGRSFASAHAAAVEIAERLSSLVGRLGRMRRGIESLLAGDDDADGVEPIDGRDGFNAYLFSAAIESRVLDARLDEGTQQELEAVWPGFVSRLAGDPDFKVRLEEFRSGPSAGVWSGLVTVRQTPGPPKGLRAQVWELLGSLNLSQLGADLDIEHAKAKAAVRRTNVRGQAVSGREAPEIGPLRRPGDAGHSVATPHHDAPDPPEGERVSPATRPDDDWLMPPVPLTAIGKRLNPPLTLKKVRVLLAGHHLQKWPSSHRQNWTVRLNGLTRSLRKQLVTPSDDEK